jgi:hypothetical protein
VYDAPEGDGKHRNVLDAVIVMHFLILSQEKSDGQMSVKFA